MYLVKNIEIKNGVIYSDNYTKTKTIKEFLNNVAHKATIIKVRGYVFNRIYLTQGNEENGWGYAFVK